MKESTLVSKIIREVKRKYPRAWIVKTSDRFTRGLPDIMVYFARSLEGVREDFPLQVGVLGVEVKTPKGRISAIQMRTLYTMRTLTTQYGGCWCICVGTESLVRPSAVDIVLESLRELGAVR